MTDPLDGLALELRATAPPAPARLRARVDAIAAQTPPAHSSWRAWFQPRRVLLVAPPTAVAAMLAVAIGHGLTSSPTHSQATQLESRFANGAERGRTMTVRGANGTDTTFDRAEAIPVPAAPVLGVSGGNASAQRSALKAQTGTTAKSAATPPPARGRAQDYRATLTVRLSSTDGMSKAMKQAIGATRAWGGYVVAATYNVPDSDGDARLIVRIPVERVQAAIQRFTNLGTLAAQDVSIRDVQAQLDGYTRQWLATRERIAKLRVKLAQAETDAQRASLELQIARAQKAAAQIRAEQVALKRQASFANVTLNLTTRDAAAAVPHKEGRIERTLGDALSILALELVFVLYGLIVIAPIALVAAIVFLAARAGRRRADDRLLGST